MHASVRRWQVRRIDALLPTAGLAAGILVAPVRKLLQAAAATATWTFAAQAQLLSAFVGGQWTQLRLFKANLVESPLCLLCGKENGTLAHRLYWCPHPALCEARDRWLPLRLLEKARAECSRGLTHRWERAIWPEPLSEHADPPAETFEWVLEPPSGPLSGHWFSDGSRAGILAPHFGSFSWAAACFDDLGVPLAIARGRSPVWAQSVPGSETWGLTQSAILSTGGNFKVDCMPCVQNWSRGRLHATGPKSRFARAWALFFAAVDDMSSRVVSWIPSHTSRQDVTDGLISQFDKDCNDVVDGHAKTISKRHTASLAAEKRYEDYVADIVTVAQWIGRAGVIVSDPATRDAAISATAKAARQRHKLDAALPPPPPPPPVAALRALEHGGHCLRDHKYGWRCNVCRVSSASWNRIAPQKCNGSAAALWAERAHADAQDGNEFGLGHSLWLSDTTIWCTTCGQFSFEATKGLKATCHRRARGTTTIWTRLMTGRHPRTNEPFAAPAVPQFRWQLTDGSPVPAPATLTAAERAPRGSAAAAKRLHSRHVTMPAAEDPAPFDSLQRAWAHPDFLQRSWARSNAAAAAAASPAVAALLEAAKSDSLPAPKRLCVDTNAEALNSMEVEQPRPRAELDDSVDEPCAKRNRAEPDTGAGLLLPTTPCDAHTATPPPVSTAKPKTSLRPVTCDAPPAKVLRLAKHAGPAALRPRGKGASYASNSTSTTSAAAQSSSRTVGTCAAAPPASARLNEVATSSSAPAHLPDCPKPGSLPRTVSTSPIHCTARCKPIITREDLRRQLSSTAVSKTGSSASKSLASHPANKRPSEAHFPANHDFPAKRPRTSSNSSSLGEFAAFFK